MKHCRECKTEVSEHAFSCPKCGCPHPAKEKWDGWGYEWKSKAEVAGMPLVHISFKFSAQRRPVVARGVFAMGQFACGIITISQFGVGFISLSQFTIAGFALCQMGVALSLIAQFGVALSHGRGQLVLNLIDFFK